MTTTEMTAEQLNGTQPSHQPPNPTRGFVSEERLVHILDTWSPSTCIEAQELTSELLRHTRTLANVLFDVTEDRACGLDLGQHSDIIDPWDLAGMGDLLAILLDLATTALGQERQLHSHASHRSPLQRGST